MWLRRRQREAVPNVLEFKQRKQLNLPDSTRPHDDLLKSAGICESETVFLLVESKKRRDLNLVGWGFGDIRGRDGSNGEEVWEQLDVCQYPNDVLTVHFAGPGRFSIRYNGEFIAEHPEIEDHKLVKLWDLDVCLGWNAEDKGDAWSADDHCGKLAAVRTYLFELVIGRLAASGRGGVLLCHGSAEASHLDGGTRIEAGLVDRQVRGLFRKSGGKCVEPIGPYRLRELAQWISAIASVDGATEIARDLELIRYGAKISTKQSYMDAVEKVCESTTYEWLEPRGTRHRSAAYWVVAEGKARGSCGPWERPFAFVVSADGDANAIFWEADRVRRRPVVYRRL